MASLFGFSLVRTSTLAALRAGHPMDTSKLAATIADITSSASAIVSHVDAIGTEVTGLRADVVSLRDQLAQAVASGAQDQAQVDTLAGQLQAALDALHAAEAKLAASAASPGAP